MHVFEQRFFMLGVNRMRQAFSPVCQAKNLNIVQNFIDDSDRTNYGVDVGCNILFFELLSEKLIELLVCLFPYCIPN